MYNYYFHYGNGEIHSFYHRFQLGNRNYILTNEIVEVSSIDFKDILIQIEPNKLGKVSRINISKRRMKETNIHISFNLIRQLFAVVHSNFKFDYHISYNKS